MKHTKKNAQGVHGPPSKRKDSGARLMTGTRVLMVQPDETLPFFRGPGEARST